MEETTIEELEAELSKLSSDFYQMGPRLNATIEKVKAMGGDVKTLIDDTNDNTTNVKDLYARIEELEQARQAGLRQLEELTGRLDGPQGEDWPVEQIRTTVRNSAFTGNLIKGTIGLIGFGGVATVIAAVLGLGRTPEQQFTFLSTTEALIDRVDDLESFEDRYSIVLQKAEKELVFEVAE